MKRGLLILLLVIPALAVADNGDETGVHLSVKPVLCITDRRTPRCDISFLVAWESERSGYYCLFNDFGDSPLRCWTEVRAGQLDDRREVTESFTYWLTGESQADRLATVAVEVLRMDSDDRRRRRRTRHVWDIN